MKKKRAGTAARPRERRHPTFGAKKDAPVHHQFQGVRQSTNRWLFPENICCWGRAAHRN